MKKNANREITFSLPVEVVLSLGMKDNQIIGEMKKLLAMKLFRDGRLSGGKAASLAGMSRIHFLMEAGQQGIEWLPYSENDVKRELS